MELTAISTANAMKNALANAGMTKALGDTSAYLAEKGVQDAAQREIRMKQVKEESTWAKVSVNAGVAAATSSAQSAER